MRTRTIQPKSRRYVLPSSPPFAPHPPGTLVKGALPRFASETPKHRNTGPRSGNRPIGSPMPTLAQALETTTPVSPLLRKARRLGLSGVDAFVSLAIERGCRHYACPSSAPNPVPSRSGLPDEELTVLLLLGENRYDPTAIRCAAQPARSPHVDPERLARLARMEKVERVLSHIARAGLLHDSEGCEFWRRLLNRVPPMPDRAEPNLPHWTRFVSSPGRQRGGIAPTRWLVPTQ
jgi:hypothetical protein